MEQEALIKGWLLLAIKSDQIRMCQTVWLLTIWGDFIMSGNKEGASDDVTAD